jgi:hypothetical protein
MNKTILTIGGIAALGVAGFFAWKKFGKKEGEGDDESEKLLKIASDTNEDEETPSSSDDLENEIDLEAEKKADEIEAESDELDETLEPSKKEQRQKARAERKNNRIEKRKQRRQERKDKRVANKDKRKKAAKITLGVAIPVVGAGMLVAKGIKSIAKKREENKEKREEKKEARQEKREEKKEARQEKRQDRKEARQERRAERRDRRKRRFAFNETDNLNFNYMYNNDEMYSADSGAMMDKEIYNATKKFNLDTAGLTPSSSKYIALKNRYQEKIAAIKKRYGNFGFDYETDSFDGDYEMFSISKKLDILEPSIDQEAIRQRRIREKRRRRKLARLAERGLSTSVAQFSNEDSDFAFNGMEF